MPYPTDDDYNNLRLDMVSAGDVVNGAPDAANVVTRTGRTIKPLAKLIAEAQTAMDADVATIETKKNNAITDIDADVTAVENKRATAFVDIDADVTAIETAKTGSETDRASIGVTKGQADIDGAYISAKKTEVDGYVGQAAATVAGMNTLIYHSVQFPEENGEAPDKQTQGFFTLPNAKTALTGAGAAAFWYGDSSMFILWDCPVDVYRGLNRAPYIAGTAANTSSRMWSLQYLAKGHNSNPTTHKLIFNIRGESGASAVWTCDTGTNLPMSVRRMGIKVVRSADNMQIDVLDIDTGTWYRGAAVAKPAGFVGVPIITSDFAIGIVGVYASYPIDFTATTGVPVPQTTPTLRGALSDFLIADKALADADVEAIVYSGANPVTQVTAALTRLYAPLVAAGAVSLGITSNKPALANGLTLYGFVNPGPTMKRQGAATYFMLNSLKNPGFIAREVKATSATVTLTGKMAGYTSRLQVRIVDRTGRIIRNWHHVKYTLTGNDISFAVTVPVPTIHRFEIQARFTEDTSVVAKTHSNLQVGPFINFWSQSEGALSVLANYTNTGQPTTLNVLPEGETSTVNFILVDGTIKCERLRPGLMGDVMINIANYIRRRTQEPIAFGCHCISGTSLRDLMDDTSTSTGRQWANEIEAHSFPINRGANGEYIVTGHIKIGWEAADNVINYSEVVNVPWYQGRVYNGGTLASVGLTSLDHYLYDGSMSMSAISVELPCNRVSTQNTNNTTDFNTEADQRDSQRNWGHLLGYRIGPPQCTHKMEGENAAGGLPAGSATHPENSDWEGGLEMSFANAEAAMIILDLNTYPGAVFFETIRAGSAANKVIVGLGNPRTFPGEGLATPPNVGYTTSFQRAIVPSPIKLRTKKAGGNPKWGFEAKIDNAGAWSINNVTAATIINGREVELTLSANYVVGQTKIAYQPGSPGSYGSTVVTQEDWRSGQLFFTGAAFAAGNEPGWAVSGSNQVLSL